MNYRRLITPGSTYFFTLNLADREKTYLISYIDTLRFAFKSVMSRHPFKVDAIVILPEHLHLMMTLPLGDANYAQRLSLIKGMFSKNMGLKIKLPFTREHKGERRIWQKRFWEHGIRDETDYENHLNYIHYNPVKHGYVETPSEWKYSSLHQYIAQGVLVDDWDKTVNHVSHKFGE